MIIMPNTTDILQLITSVAGSIDVVASYSDVDQNTPPVVKPFGRTLLNITTATTSDIVPAPAAATTRTPEYITIRNKHATLSNNLTVNYRGAGPVTMEMVAITLRPGETLQYIPEVGWYTLAASSAPLTNQNTADVVANAADTYLTGSAIQVPSNRPIAVGTTFHWRLSATKTGAGIAPWVFNLRFGVNGTTADTARLVFTSAVAQTGVIDTGTWEIKAIVRGPIGAASVTVGVLEFQHRLVTTGFSTQGADAYAVTSAAFDVTTAGLIVGLSCNPGAAGVFTFQIVSTDVVNM